MSDPLKHAAVLETLEKALMSSGSYTAVAHAELRKRVEEACAALRAQGEAGSEHKVCVESLDQKRCSIRVCNGQWDDHHWHHYVPMSEVRPRDPRKCARCGGTPELDASYHCATCYGEMELRASSHDPRHAEKEQWCRDVMHPCGRCTCGGGGECEWCVATAAKEAALEAALVPTKAPTKTDLDAPDSRDIAAGMVLEIADEMTQLGADLGNRKHASDVEHAHEVLLELEHQLRLVAAKIGNAVPDIDAKLTAAKAAAMDRVLLARIHKAATPERVMAAVDAELDDLARLEALKEKT